MLERKYYPINEHGARIAHEMMSFRNYTENEKTEEYKAVENTEIMRYQIIFEEIPAPEVRSLLKENGFKWAPSQGGWQRQITGNGRWAYNRVLEELQKICG